MKSVVIGNGVVCLVIALITCFSAPLCAAQSGVCDPVIEKLSGSGKLAYKFIGPQCEGTYSETTGGNLDLQLLNVTWSVPRADFRAVPALDLKWYPPRTADVRLRAVSTRYKYYYRMDAHPATATTFHWQTDLLKQSDLSMPQIGFLAWTQSSVLGTSQFVYLPIKVVTGATSGGPSEDIVLSVLPSVDLDEVNWRATRLGGAGSKDALLPGGGLLGLGYYPAHKPISIPIRLGARSGYFRVEVSAKHQGGSLVRSYVIYAPR